MDNKAPIDEGFEDWVTEVGLKHASNLAEQGKLEEAERQYKLMLKQTELATGPSSALAGMIVLELIDFYDKVGRTAEAEELWPRLRNIVLGCLWEQGWRSEEERSA